MTRPRHSASDWPAWIITLVALLFLFAAALTADGQTCPPMGLDPACAAEHPLPCPYPVARVTAAHQAAIIAKGGPWVLAPGILAPYPGMAREYQTAEDWRRAAWSLPHDVYRWPYCREGAPACGLSVENAAWAVAKVLKPNSAIDSCFGHTGNHGVAAESFVWLYGAKPTFGQWLQLECNADRGGWWAADGRLHQALLCSQGGTPPPEPTPVPPPVPVPPPPPPEPPSCEPYEGSNCQARCTQVGKDREWCLDAERENGARLLFDLCSGVCRDDEPRPEPEPEPTPEEPEPGMFWLPVEPREGGVFLPGVFIPSTGKLEIQLFPVEDEGGGGGW